MKLFIPFFIFIFSFAVYSQTATIISKNANLRGTPANRGKVVETLPQGSEVEIVKQQGPWYLVQSSDYVGWVHGNTIRLNEQASTAFMKDEVIYNIPVLEKEVAKKDPQIGMTTSEARQSTWGEPTKINRTTTASGVQEQWVYDPDDYLSLNRRRKLSFLFFTNGRLTSISD